MTRTIRETLGHFKYVMIMAFLCVEEGDHLKLEVKKMFAYFMCYEMVKSYFCQGIEDLPL